MRVCAAWATKNHRTHVWPDYTLSADNPASLRRSLFSGPMICARIPLPHSLTPYYPLLTTYNARRQVPYDRPRDGQAVRDPEAMLGPDLHGAIGDGGGH